MSQATQDAASTVDPGTPAVPGKFTANGFPLLSAGNTMDLLAKAPGLWAHLKIYAEGGENGLHAHSAEDHLFFILDGEATFLDASGRETVIGRGEGMVVPRQTLYCFRSTGATNLVMLRVGAPTDPAGAGWYVDEPTGELRPGAMMARVGADAQPAPGDAPGNRTGAVRGVPVPDQSFHL